MSKREDIFIEKIKEFEKIQDDYLEIIEESFEFIRSRNITEKSEIERLLNIVLSMMQTDKTIDLYTRICLYYHAIDKESAMDYAQYYLDMYNDDSVIREIINVEKQIKKIRNWRCFRKNNGSYEKIFELFD